jgi:SAM-dependent methyltransferase
MKAEVVAAPSRFELQADQYAFPYHWIPVDDGSWSVTRSLPWGFEYLGYVETVKRLALAGAPATALDFGCGDGRLVAELVSAGVARVVGVDLVDSAVDFARGFTAGLGDAATIVTTPIQDLSFDGFDVAVAMETFEHIEDRQLPSVVEALWTKLAPHGRLVVSVPTVNLPLRPKHFRHYDEALLAAQLAPWFDVDEVNYVHKLGPATRMLRRVLVNRVAAVTSRSLLRAATRYYRSRLMITDASHGAHLVAVCTKRASGRGPASAG